MSLRDWRDECDLIIQSAARRLCRSPGFRDDDIDDVVQELVHELHKNAPRFNPERGTHQAFIRCLIKSKCISLVRRRKAAARSFRSEGPSLDARIRDANGESVERGGTMDADCARRHTGQSPRSGSELADLAMDVGDVLDAMPPDLREVARLCMSMSLSAVARALGKSRRQVENDRAEIRKRFEQAGLRNYLR